MHLSKYTGDKAELGVSACGLRTNDLTTDVGRVDCRKCKVKTLGGGGEPVVGPTVAYAVIIHRRCCSSDRCRSNRDDWEFFQSKPKAETRIQEWTRGGSDFAKCQASGPYPLAMLPEKS